MAEPTIGPPCFDEKNHEPGVGIQRRLLSNI